MTPEASWWFVGDLHLDPDGADPRGVDRAFAGFVDDVVLPSSVRDAHLVLLGDTFELRHSVDPGAGVARTAAAFPGLFDGLRRCLDAGVEVHVVCGNHDYPLAGTAARDMLHRLLATGTDRVNAGVEIHPWLLHRAGLFYAEHGNQHHELNRLPRLLLASRPDGVALPSTVLEQWERHRETGLRRLAAVTRAFAAAADEEDAAATAPYQQLLAEMDGHQLTTETVHALHALARFSSTGALTSTAHRVVARRRGRPDHDSYLRRACERIDRLLQDAGEPQPVGYVFGHTHVHALVEVGRAGASYANTGTWSRYVRDGGDPGRFPFVVVEETGGGAAVRLAHWDPARRTVEAL
jgi:UDP-2,3-diacylglucosamine pyrophosphatase LpxH